MSWLLRMVSFFYPPHRTQKLYVNKKNMLAYVCRPYSARVLIIELSVKYGILYNQNWSKYTIHVGSYLGINKIYTPWETWYLYCI